MFAPIFVRGVPHTPRLVLARDVVEREQLLWAYGHWDVEAAEGSALHVLRDKLRAIQLGRLPRLSASELGSLATGARDVIELARGFAVDHRRWFPRDSLIHLRVDTEQRPDPESRIVATGDRDGFGLPRLALDWRVSALEKRTVVRTSELLAAELDRANIGVVDPIRDPFDARTPWGALRGDSFHMMGGTRMAIDPSAGVVDTDARVFGVDNLYVASTSVFPTGGMANPTLTLIALALRLGDHLERASASIA
jgi:choline dehydrogenase-like flavoprotein